MPAKGYQHHLLFIGETGSYGVVQIAGNAAMGVSVLQPACIPRPGTILVSTIGLRLRPSGYLHDLLPVEFPFPPYKIYEVRRDPRQN
jgi:hypothetical protein